MTKELLTLFSLRRSLHEQFAKKELAIPIRKYMKIRTILLLLFFVFLTVNQSFASPKISLPQGTEYELGELEEGQIYTRSFLIENKGDTPLEVKVVRPSCGCTSIVYPKEKVVIGPWQAIKAKFTFNTEGIDGETIKYIYVESSDPQEPLIKLKLTAQVERVHLDSVQRFLSFGLFTILTAGLIDGINPCAFSVLVFFISFLNFVGYRKKELLILGLTFIFSVFLTYVLIGFGLFKFIQAFEIFKVLSKVVYLAIASLAVVLGIFSIYDWYIYRKTKNTEALKLKLPNFIKLKIHKIIQDSSRDKKKKMAELAAAIFLSGFLVSLLESICTGQTYIPTIAYVLKTTPLRSLAVFYLLLYNLMFVLPLAAILIAALCGVTSEMFSKAAKSHLGKIKLLTALLFFLLGILLFLAKGASL